MNHLSVIFFMNPPVENRQQTTIAQSKEKMKKMKNCFPPMKKTWTADEVAVINLVVSCLSADRSRPRPVWWPRWPTVTETNAIWSLKHWARGGDESEDSHCEGAEWGDDKRKETKKRGMKFGADTYPDVNRTGRSHVICWCSRCDVRNLLQSLSFIWSCDFVPHSTAEGLYPVFLEVGFGMLSLPSPRVRSLDPPLSVALPPPPPGCTRDSGSTATTTEDVFEFWVTFQR